MGYFEFGFWPSLGTVAFMEGAGIGTRFARKAAETEPSASKRPRTTTSAPTLRSAALTTLPPTLAKVVGVQRTIKTELALEAKKEFFRVPRVQGTIPHPVQGERAAGVVFLRPAAPGTGVIAGGPVRAVLECAGIHDVLSKSLGSSNQINIVHATVAALQMLEEPEAVAARRGLRVEDVAPAALLKARAEQTEAAVAAGVSQ